MPAGRVTAASRVFVVGAYVANGGMLMAYHLGRILHRDFGLRVLAVTVREETAETSPFAYDPVFESVSLEQMSRMASATDVVIANPSFSRLNLGLTSPALKIMYVQHFNTFRTLDLGFDHYVAVSEVVVAFLDTVWGLSTPVIPPFVEVDAHQPRPWSDRPPDSVAIHCKGDMRQQLLILDRLRSAIAPQLPQVRLDGVLAQASHREFLGQIGAARHLLSLPVAEGFGLTPLEAMALGTTVVGFDALGGRDYLRPGVNCEAVVYPDIEGLAAGLVRVLQNPAHAAALSRAGQATAVEYSYERFRSAWRAAFGAWFGSMPTTLLTGLPRSGTTLVCALLSRLPDTAALSEPRILDLHGDRDLAVRQIDAFLAVTRAAALATGRVPSQARGGAIPQNVAEAPRGDGALRRVLASPRLIEVGKPLNADFHLIVKHPALFTALAGPLRQRHRLVAIVRHPLAVLASWQTVDMPPNRGRLPRAEAFAPDLAAELAAAAPDVLSRQITLLRWLFGVYATFPPADVLRYEDLIADPRATLAAVSPQADALPANLEGHAIEQRYRGVDLLRLANALLAIGDVAERFYPDFARSLDRWRGSDT